LESGIRMFFAIPSTGTNFYANYSISDTLVQSQFTYDKIRPFTIVPYIGVAYDCHYKRIRVGVQLWFQRALQPMNQYDFKVKFGSNLNFQAKSITYGMALGTNLYFRLLSF